MSAWNWLVVFFKGKFGGGISSVIQYLLKLVNEKVLAKVNPEELKKYAGLVIAIAEFGEKVLDLYVMDEAKRAALAKTVEALRTLADALADGTVTSEELDKVIDEVSACIKAWKDAKSSDLTLKQEALGSETIEAK